MTARFHPITLLAGILGMVFCCSSASFAQSRCRVTDPTGTPLNVRPAPDGRITGVLYDGLLVSVIGRGYGRDGKPWAYVADLETGERLGWVFREFISCF